MTVDFKPLSLLWLRRDLRAHDHAALHAALAHEEKVQPVFVFDTDVLARFPARNDRRLAFIADALVLLDARYRERGGGLLALHGSAGDVIPRLARALNARRVVTAGDYEPGPLARDEKVAREVTLERVQDAYLFSPRKILKGDGTPYKVFTPYAAAWRAALTPAHFAPYRVDERGRYADVTSAMRAARQAGLKVLNMAEGAASLLREVGYDYNPAPQWPVADARLRLEAFSRSRIARYAEQRNFMADEQGTSRLSPYLRFGLVSVREAYAHAADAPGGGAWLNELIWREFYAMILAHFPESANEDWNPAYRGRVNWADSSEHFTAWQNGRTGYPVVDAAMRELLETGWMHNRARMITASFLTKHLRIDWRRGEEHFAQYLMDYDQASNVGGWQWAASTGTDAQPYFRVFNPMLQSEKFDPSGDYIRRYVPELRGVKGKAIHAPWKAGVVKGYPAPIVDHDAARQQAIAMFQQARG